MKEGTASPEATPVPESAAKTVPESAAKPAPKLAPKPAPKPAPSIVRISSDPAGARVFLNGTFQCTAPCAVTFRGNGPFRLKAEADAFKPWKRYFVNRAAVEALNGRLDTRLEMDL